MIFGSDHRTSHDQLDTSNLTKDRSHFSYRIYPTEYVTRRTCKKVRLTSKQSFLCLPLCPEQRQGWSFLALPRRDSLLEKGHQDSCSSALWRTCSMCRWLSMLPEKLDLSRLLARPPCTAAWSFFSSQWHGIADCKLHLEMQNLSSRSYLKRKVPISSSHLHLSSDCR